MWYPPNVVPANVVSTPELSYIASARGTGITFSGCHIDLTIVPLNNMFQPDPPLEDSIHAGVPDVGRLKTMDSAASHLAQQ